MWQQRAFWHLGKHRLRLAQASMTYVIRAHLADSFPGSPVRLHPAKPLVDGLICAVLCEKRMTRGASLP